jgi:molecular chaperone DnaK (HSP70)
MKIVGKKPIDLAADYLQHLWEHASDTLKSRFGETYMETIQIKLVLTVPAMWDHQAQELTKKAAKMAGFGRRGKTKMELCSEPEAAARYVFSENVALRVSYERSFKVAFLTIWPGRRCFYRL